ncbi:hypothetical protein QBC38DRAFT_460991 [Podospora fimiseda]|uniref:Uncharacterized protein n=1 Tax=Podospora fimiseda TaxID=252190 RepID=A0AAN6YN91_9PEZI|nr:hypothetical protein QBC38DRAFT_460991 [Podospora fimiseda]
MTTRIDLSPLKPPSQPLTPSQSIFLSIFDNALTWSPNPQTASTQIAYDLRNLFIETRSISVTQGLLPDLWKILLDILSIIPIDHPWQHAVIISIRRLQAIPSEIVFLPDHNLFWCNLPGLSEYFYSRWQDITEDQSLYKVENINLHTRLTSFASQLLSPTYLNFLPLCYQTLRSALETPPQLSWQTNSVYETKFWVATEVLVRSAPLLFRDMTQSPTLTTQSEEMISVGPLCQGNFYERSIERWNYWREKMSRMVKGIGGDVLGKGRDFPPPEEVSEIKKRIFELCLRGLNAIDYAEGGREGVSDP